MDITEKDTTGPLETRCSRCQVPVPIDTYRAHVTMRWCGYRQCLEFYCTTCKRQDWSTGAVGCLCDRRGVRGHGTHAEQPGPGGRRKRNSRRQHGGYRAGWKAKQDYATLMRELLS